MLPGYEKDEPVVKCGTAADVGPHVGTTASVSCCYGIKLAVDGYFVSYFNQF